MHRLLFPLLAAAAVVAPALAQDPPIPEDGEVMTTASGLQYSVLAPGEGELIKKYDVATVHYTGWLTDGTKFDSSRDRNQPFPVTVGTGSVVPGWDEGLQLMRPGARYKFTIPPALGYGPGGRPPVIPPNSTMVFDVEVVSVERGPELPEFHAANPDAQVTTAGGLVYEVLTPGADAPPAEDASLVIVFAIWKEDGELLNCTELSGQQLLGTKAKLMEFPLPVFKESLELLTVGRRVRVLCPIEKGPPGGTEPTVWEFELLRATSPLPVPEFRMSAPESLTKTASGLAIETLTEGTGATPARSDRVRVHYAGWLTDGTLFDSSYPNGEPAEFAAGGLIPGFTEALLGMKAGGVVQVTIPSRLGYGKTGSPPKIGPDADLVFRIELIEVLGK